MDRLIKSQFAVLGALAVAIGFAGCTSYEDEAGGRTTSPAPAVASPTRSPSSPPEILEPTWYMSEDLLGQLPSVRGTAEIGPVSSAAGSVAVYIRCYGPGTVEVEIVGSATLTQQCVEVADDPGTRNEIQVHTPEGFVVRGSAENANLWSLAVTDNKGVQ